MPAPAVVPDTDMLPALRAWVDDMRRRLPDAGLVRRIVADDVVALRYGKDAQAELLAYVDELYGGTP